MRVDVPAALPELNYLFILSLPGFPVGKAPRARPLAAISEEPTGSEQRD